jgi:hypothetical protein
MKTRILPLSRRRFLCQAALGGTLAFPAVRHALGAGSSASGEVR